MLKSKVVLPGLLFSLLLNVNTVYAANYTVMKGDSLWQISQRYNISIEKIVELNHLKSDNLSIGQVLILHDTPSKAPLAGQNGTVKQSAAIPVTQGVPTIPAAYRSDDNRYIVKSGDTLSGISKTFAITVEDLRRLNNIQGDMIYAGQTLVLRDGVSRGYIDRSEAVQAQKNNYVSQGMNKSARYGRLVDWFEEGINILKAGKVFDATDTQTGKNISLKVLGGSNHCDVEPLTKEDTDTMLRLFANWTWEPRPVCIHVDGKDIAASLSGMPHTNIENISDNGVTGHFDMYLHNSKPHGSGISKSYVQQHYHALQRAAAK